MPSIVTMSLAVSLLLGIAQVTLAEDPESNVLAAGYKLPKGFTSIQASEQPKTKFRQIDALYTDPTDGTSLRFTTVRGSKEMAEPGRHPIDVCIRDGKTGEVVHPPQIFGDKPMVEGCVVTDAGKEQSKKRSGQILEALDALTQVRFKDEYRPEYVALVNQSMHIVSEGKMPTEFGGGVIIHRKNPELPVPKEQPAKPATEPAAK